jgi:hypothetical protein
MGKPTSENQRRLDAAAMTARVRRAANVVGVAVIAWIVLFVLSSDVVSLRADSPWSEDPADLVVSLTFLLLGVVGPVTFVRVQGDAESSVMRPRTADDVMRGLYVALGTITVADATMLLAWVDSGQAGGMASIGFVLAMLLGTSIATAGVAGVVVYRAARVSSSWRQSIDREERDALDDIVAFTLRIRPLRTSAVAFAGFLNGRFSPRRHRWAFATLVAVGFGLGYSTWHLLVEGPAPSASASFTVLIVFASLGAAAVLAGWIAFGGYLRLVRRVSD